MKSKQYMYETGYDSMVLSVAHSVQETREKFIFETISDFLSSKEQLEVSKQELVNAIKLYRKCKWHDLELDPNDLPPLNTRVVFIAKDFKEGDAPFYFTGELIYNKSLNTFTFENDDWEGYNTEASYSLKRVIAWSNIEQYEDIEIKPLLSKYY